MTYYRKTKILEQIGLRRPCDYMKGNAFVALSCREGDVLCHIVLCGEHNLVKVRAEPSPIVRK
jgi:hypothetical protein